MNKEHRAHEPELTADEIKAVVFARLKKYETLNLLEHFGMFMALAQVLELRLKQLLQERHGTAHERMERWSLTRTANELRNCEIRGDFCALVDGLVEHRNHIAHELLANEMMLRSLLDNDASRFEVRVLERGTYELEQLMFLYEWCEKHNAWG